VNILGDGPQSSESADITAALVPDAPGDPQYASSTQTQFSFTWTSPQVAGRSNGGTPLTAYLVQWDSGNGSPYSTIKTLDASTTSQTLTAATDGLVTGNKYKVRVIAVNNVGQGTPSVALEIMPASLPGAPNTPTATSVSSTQISFVWTQTAGTNGGTPIFDYVVYWDAGIASNQVVLTSTTTNLLTYTATSLSPGTSYKFWVAAINYVGTGALSSSFT